jgi:heptosyltransferase-3
LPALKALRAAHPQARIEILGYPHTVIIADKRFYADALRSIEYAALSRFFARDAELPLDLRDYFRGFDLILSYLYDPDQIFEDNLRRCGAKRILLGPAWILPGTHAARQLAHPLQALGINVSDLAAKIFPSDEDRAFARRFLENCEAPVLAFHPGSGSERKNWPIENWIELAKTLLNTNVLFRTIIFVSGEADEKEITRLRTLFKDERHVRFADGLPLPQLAALLEQSTFIGHDSGISHLAAAAGARCFLLFGPTDPKIWAPQNKDVCVLVAPNGDLTQLDVTTVRKAIDCYAGSHDPSGNEGQLSSH